MLTSEQEAYRDWFWSNSDEKELQDNLDLLTASKREISNFADDGDLETVQANNQLARMEEVVAQTRQAELVKCSEVLKGVAEMYLIQGDMHGVEVCQHLENLLLTPELAQIQNLTQEHLAQQA